MPQLVENMLLQWREVTLVCLICLVAAPSTWCQPLVAQGGFWLCWKKVVVKVSVAVDPVDHQ